MHDWLGALDLSLADLAAQEWKTRIAAVANEHGEFRQLGKRHFSTFIREGSTLLVTFETMQGIRALSDAAQPFGFDLVTSRGWSHLGLVSDGDTWFRDSDVYAFFDEMTDDGVFDAFDHVVFYGAVSCGYAAAAFSVAAPGATVVAVQPQATLDPDVTGWDCRFTDMRHLNFTDRYGFAPDMVDAADRAFVVFDPHEEYDAMHAALFHRPNVTRLRMTSMGSALQIRLIEMQILYRIILLAGSGDLTEREFYRLLRARRDNIPYLRSLMARLDSKGRPALNSILCRNVTSRMKAPRFYRRLMALEQGLNT